MQSFGDEGFLGLRDAGPAPSRSAVLGALAAACGYTRDDRRLLDLHRALRVHVAVLAPGLPMVDYHTVEAMPGANKTQTYRTYHHDASFLALVETAEGEPGAESLLSEAREALAHPQFVAYLGRRSCPPAVPFLPLGVPDAGSVVQMLIASSPVWPAERVSGWPRWRRPLRRPTRLALHLEGHLTTVPAGITADSPRHGYRRDRLVALPRHYTARPVTLLRVRLPEPPGEKAESEAKPDLSNDAFFDAAG